MTSYAVAHLRTVTMGPEIAAYLQRIDATLAPFGGRFLIHGGEAEVLLIDAGAHEDEALARPRLAHGAGEGA